MSRYVTLGLGTAAMLFAVLSARLGVPYLAYGVVACAVAAMVLCAWDKLDRKMTPYLVFLLGLAFLYQTTLMTNNLIGTDIHTEYYMYQRALDGWDSTYPHAYNTAIGSTVIAPWLTNWLGVPGYWIYKVIFPFLFAFVPLLLFLVYRREFGEKTALLASILFITLPTYLLEMVGLPRQMLAEIMLATVLALLIVKPWPLRYTLPVAGVCIVAGFMFHYLIGPIIIMFVLGLAVFQGVIRRVWVRFRTLQPSVIAAHWVILLVILPAIVGVAYFTQTADGVVAFNFVQLSHWVKRIPSYLTQPVTDLGGDVELVVPDEPDEEASFSPREYLLRQEPLIRTALGLDFAEANHVGRIFRIFQFGIQIALLIGCGYLVFGRHKLSSEYTGFAVTAIAIMVACIVLPRFSNIINATRFYHLALFPLAPLIVVGATRVLKSYKVVVLSLLIPYVLLTTGVVFEAAGEKEIGLINAPYSIALSNHRISAVGEYSDSDLEVALYIKDHGLEPVLTDIHGMLLLSQFLDPYNYINRSPRTGRYYMTVPAGSRDEKGQAVEDLGHGWGYLPNDVSLLGHTYIFLTERSAQTQTVVFKPEWYAPSDSSTGMRTQYTFDYIGLTLDHSTVYRSGDALLLETGT